MEPSTTKILEWVDILKTQPKMLIALDTIDYETLRIYVEGYIEGIDDVLNANLMQKINSWFQESVHQKACVYWTTHISQLHAKQSDEERKTILLDTINKFFIENPHWYLEAVDA